MLILGVPHRRQHADGLVRTPALALMRRYHVQSAEKGRACIIDVTPEQAEFLDDRRNSILK